jgi:hypothetical protein
MFEFYTKDQLNANLEKKKTHFDKIQQIKDGCFVNINFLLLKDLCEQNKNRFTNLFGYWQFSSSTASKIAIKILEESCFLQYDHEKACKVISNYLLMDNVCHTNFFTLLINNFDNLFHFI